MKRPLAAGDTDSSASFDEDTKKKIRPECREEEEEGMPLEAEAVLLDDNLLYEVLRHVDDGRTLAKASCVSRQWKRTAQDERIWELICTRHYHRSPIQLRAVVLALGGFRQLYSSHLWPLLKPSSSNPPVTSMWPCLPLAPESRPHSTTAKSKARWGKDEVNLSLSLLSIKYFEKMSFNNRNK
ncbi:hypothetical protein F511_13802 [Dorcoceras hygrometricum]|uniref:F-box domain-containing protein n=1 Tax=Dorcoceras hygrometricum TaxID=472368 RepID=A0A2Z7D919_9LAMI|nr:hypothetical protein F511_13802 [Dorcoceras hygrometricum]